MYMRALLVGEHTPVRAVTPVHCFCCGATQSVRPLYRCNQLLRAEWVACIPCGRSGVTPDRLADTCKHVADPIPRFRNREGGWSYSW
jgi:hypothetical protein